MSQNIAMMPLRKNVPEPGGEDWTLTTCKKCGRECWYRHKLAEEARAILPGIKFLNDFIAAEVAEQAGEEMRKFVEAAGIFAEQTAYPPEEIMETMANALNGCANPKRVRRAFSDLTIAWDRKEAREKLRAVERETASRFRQYKIKESAWAAQRRTGKRRREWRGPWKEN